MNNPTAAGGEDNSQALLNQIILDYLKEQRRKRRWRWVLRFIVLLILVLIIWNAETINLDSTALTSAKPHAGIIEVSGPMFDKGLSSADNFAKGMNNAYKNENLKGLVIRINSPGGSAVQADNIYGIIRYYKEKRPEVNVYAVCVDACLSAAYFSASAADEIYANPSSLIGSIGVIYNGFGFVDTLKMLGMTRRLQTAGSNKGLLDPFSPESPDDKDHLQAMLDGIHTQFITRVKEGRGNRLKDDPDMFTGLFWVGEKAKDLGLIDGYGTTGWVIKEKIGVDDAVDYTYKQNIFEKFAQNMGAAMVSELPKALGMQQGVSALTPVAR